MALSYRMHTKDDEAELIRLWSEQSGWDDVDAATWSHRLMHTPLGEAAIALALNDASGKIVGQFAFLPSLVSVDGREVSAYRPFAPILNKETRGVISVNPLKHPVIAMYWHAVNALRERGHGLIYTMPDPRWLRALRMLPVLHCGSFPLWSLPLPLANPLPLGAGYAVAEMETRGERVEHLWQITAKLHGCIAVRDSRTLSWKTSHGDYKVLGVERDGELVGLVTSVFKKRNRQWLICDLLATDNNQSLHATLCAVVNLAHANAFNSTPDAPLVKAAVLATPSMQPVLRDLGFRRDDYDFPLMVHILDSSLTKEAVSPSRWYVSAND